MTPSRRIRRAPLSDRVKAYLNPWDFLLWLSEEINDSEWQEVCTQWATPAGIVINIVFMIARANVGGDDAARGDEVFGDYNERFGSGWLAWFVRCSHTPSTVQELLTVKQASFLVHILSFLSVLNAFYTFSRKRHYRLFEANVDVAPSTPSARRVKVDSSPLSYSPLQFLSSIFSQSGAESRAHPDAARDVWELAVWDPTPLCLRLFCLFSPGHVLVYWLFLPLRPLDPRPSVTVVTTISVVALFSISLLTLQSFFTQQARDTALVHKEVANEYDAKFVHPTLNKPVRDVGTQMIPAKYAKSIPEVQTYTPTTYVNRGFQVSPNPNYTAHIDPDSAIRRESRLQRAVTTPSLHSPGIAADGDFSSPIRPTPTPAMRAPAFRASTGSANVGDSAGFRVYNQARSPLRKQAGANLMRESSPLKQSTVLDQPNGISARTSASRPATDGLKRERRPY